MIKKINKFKFKKPRAKKAFRLFNPLGIIRTNAVNQKLSAKNKRFNFTWKKFFKWSAYALGLLLLVFVAMVVIFSFDLPKPGQLAQYKPISSTKIYDRNGALIYDIFGNEKRTAIKSEDIPDAVKQATISIEDRGFYQHNGVYLRSIFRAVLADVISGSKSQGGSTITQQLVRNAIETVGTKKTFIRKIKEVVLALEFERIHSKDEIITMYLNEISYGNSNYGIEAASLTYYSKSVKELDPNKVTDNNEKAKNYAKIATLAALPNRPTYYNPYGSHIEQLKNRRDLILLKMVEQNFITKEMGDTAKAVAIDEGLAKTYTSIVAPHFSFYVREQIVDLLGGGQEGEQKLVEGGYKITTTLDMEKQKIAQDVITKNTTSIFKSTGATNAALVSIDVTTGQILAMVGSVDFNNKTFGSVNIATALRQPGSSFKPIVYATLFKKNWSPGSTLFDIEGNYNQSTPNVIWPHNYSGGGRGPVTVRSALAQSLNISAIKSQALAGTKESIDTAKDLGLTTLSTPDKYGLAMVLGSAEVKMTEMAAAYGVFANNGVLHPVSSILKIEDKNGQLIQEWKDQPKNVLNENIAYEITSILSDNAARTPTFGSNSPLILKGRPVAAKTGTTSSYRDAWTIGYTPQIATAVWVGNNDNKEMTHSGAGAMAAAPIWRDYMQQALANLPVVNFTRPAGIKDCSLAKYSNKKPTDSTPAENIIKDICSEWQNPTQNDDAYQTVKLYKPDPTKLATDATPPALVISKIFATIHSERPNDPVWENPVLNWARDNGIGTDAIPTATYDPSTANDSVNISISSPNSGETVNGTISLKAEISSIFGITGATFYIDDVAVGNPSAPWSLTFNTSNIADGDHVFKIIATDSMGQQNSKSNSFKVNNASTLIISAATAIRSSDGLTATVSWTTNHPADGIVQYGLTTTYGSSKSEGGSPVTSHTMNISGLDPTKDYHCQIVSKNAESSATSQDIKF